MAMYYYASKLSAVACRRSSFSSSCTCSPPSSSPLRHQPEHTEVLTSSSIQQDLFQPSTSGIVTNCNSSQPPTSDAIFQCTSTQYSSSGVVITCSSPEYSTSEIHSKEFNSLSNISSTLPRQRLQLSMLEIQPKESNSVTQVSSSLPRRKRQNPPAPPPRLTPSLSHTLTSTPSSKSSPVRVQVHLLHSRINSATPSPKQSEQMNYEQVYEFHQQLHRTYLLNKEKQKILPPGKYYNSGGSAGEQRTVPDAEADRDLHHEILYRDGGYLVSGSLDALVQHMVPTADYYPDRAYLFAFLLSSRLFIKPHELLGEICALCDQQQKLCEKTVPAKERLDQFIPHLVQLLAEWTEIFPYDFRDERVMAHVRAITHKCVTAEPGVRKEVSTLLQNLLHRLTALEKYEEFLQRISSDASTSCIESVSTIDMTELCPVPAFLAQQLTHIELERLSYIGPEEFVQAFAKEYPHLETSFKDMKKTRNLESYVQWFNRLSYFVATEVCKHSKKKQRIKVIEYWIETARECFNIGNFNSLMAIIAGLNMSPVSRLKKTWSKVQSAKFSILEHQMDPSSNFSSYRSTLKAAMWRSTGATDERQRIVIPFFSLLVKDLYFLNEGCSNRLPNGHINFEKFWQLAKQVTEFMTWKQVVCPFEKNTKIISFLQETPVFTENALALASFECEPPENNHEKERCKSLKLDLNL